MNFANDTHLIIRSNPSLLVEPLPFGPSPSVFSSPHQHLEDRNAQSYLWSRQPPMKLQVVPYQLLDLPAIKPPEKGRQRKRW